MPDSLVGELLELDVGPPGHGGFCVARRDGRVVFVRHALPGERVRALVREDRGSFCRADAVEILRPSPDRVPAPCPHAGPGRCGGCDWQHASAAAQRAIKASVIAEQFTRLAGLDARAWLTEVEPLPGGLLGWRSRIAYAVGPDGRAGLRRHRSHEVEPIGTCPLGVPGVGDSAVLDRDWPDYTAVEVAAGDGASQAVLGHRPGPGRQVRGRRPPDRVEVLDGPARLRHRVGDRVFEVDAAGFWQVHPAAAGAFSDAMLDALAPRAGEAVLELYSGAGLLTAALAGAVGASGRVLGIESSARAVSDAAGNLVDLPHAEVRRGRVGPALLRSLQFRPDLVVLDPPRSGAGCELITAVTRLAPRLIGYLACDPAALARDTAAALETGWQLRSLRAFDAFPMTHHVECLAVLEPPRAGGSRRDAATPTT